MKRIKFSIELDLNGSNLETLLPCGLKIPLYSLLEDIWMDTGCDMPGERGTRVCSHCGYRYFFYLFSSKIDL